MSLSEVFLILIVAMLVLKPSDWKIFARSVKGFISYISKLKKEIIGSFEDSSNDEEQINNYLAKIISLSGKYEGEYDLPSVKAYYHRILIEKHKNL
ncbi:MAG UNVERIFIED_CONTAM: DUF2672 domain-containing protein [Rickettsiaceae bacterium]|jgi:Sec-independent protein translocase protein TatA